MEALLQDIRYGFRMLVKSPGFTAAAVIAPAFSLFISTIEIACTLFIVWYASTWPNPEAQNSE